MPDSATRRIAHAVTPPLLAAVVAGSLLLGGCGREPSRGLPPAEDTATTSTSGGDDGAVRPAEVQKDTTPTTCRAVPATTVQGRKGGGEIICSRLYPDPGAPPSTNTTAPPRP